METGLTGGKWRPCNIGSVEAHNERRPEYLESVKNAGLNLYFFRELSKNNSHWVNDLDRYKDKTVAEVFDEMKKKYTEKTGQKPQLKEKIRVNKKTGKEYKVEGWAPIQEMCPPIKKDTKIEDFDYLKKWAKKYGIEIIRIDLHKDEGYHDEKTGEYKMNYHAHVVASFFDWETGRTVKPPSESMSEMQTILAIALGMGRGKRKEETGAKALTAMQYRLKKEREDLEKVEAEKTAAGERLKNIESEIKKCETKRKGLMTMIKNLEAQREAVEIDIAALKEEYEDLGNMSQEEYQKKLDDYQRKLAEIEEKLSDKKAKVDETIEQIRDLGKKKHQQENKYNDSVRDYNRLRKQMDDSLKERWSQIEKEDRAGIISRQKTHISIRDEIIYRRWPAAKSAVDAIYQLGGNITKKSFDEGQIIAIEKALESSGIDRKDAALDLLNLVQKQFDENRSPTAWVQQAAEEVIKIADFSHPAYAMLEQSGVDNSGSASYINDLTGWDGESWEGKKKKGRGI